MKLLLRRDQKSRVSWGTRDPTMFGAKVNL